MMRCQTRLCLKIAVVSAVTYGIAYVDRENIGQL